MLRSLHFQGNDIEWLKMIECLKKSGMSIKDIKTYLELTLQGDDTIHERLELFKKQRRILQEQMASLQRTLDMLDYKCWYYETAEKAGTTDVVTNIPVEALPEPKSYHCSRSVFTLNDASLSSLNGML